MTGPHIVLIGGVPGCGKTTLAGLLARRMSVNLVLGGDLLREFARGIVDPSASPALFSSVYDCWKLVSDRPSKDAVIRGFERQAVPMNQGVLKVAQRCLNDGESVIIEYIHLLPEQLGDLFLRSEVYSVVLTVTDPALHRDRLRRRGADTHVRSNPQRLVDQLEHYRWMQDRLVQSAIDHGIAVHPVDQEDLPKMAERWGGMILQGRHGGAILAP